MRQLRERVALAKQPHLCPRHAGALRAAVQPSTPDAVDRSAHSNQPAVVSDHANVGEVPYESAADPEPLLAERPVSVAPAPVADVAWRARKTTSSGLELNHPVASLGRSDFSPGLLLRFVSFAPPYRLSAAPNEISQVSRIPS